MLWKSFVQAHCSCKLSSHVLKVLPLHIKYIKFLQRFQLKGETVGLSVCPNWVQQWTKRTYLNYSNADYLFINLCELESANTSAGVNYSSFKEVKRMKESLSCWGSDLYRSVSLSLMLRYLKCWCVSTWHFLCMFRLWCFLFLNSPINPFIIYSCLSFTGSWGVGANPSWHGWTAYHCLRSQGVFLL